MFRESKWSLQDAGKRHANVVTKRTQSIGIVAVKWVVEEGYGNFAVDATNEIHWLYL